MLTVNSPIYFQKKIDRHQFLQFLKFALLDGSPKVSFQCSDYLISLQSGVPGKMLHHPLLLDG